MERGSVILTCLSNLRDILMWVLIICLDFQIYSLHLNLIKQWKILQNTCKNGKNMYNRDSFIYGRMAERSKAAVLKTVDVKASWGSNPYPSANKGLIRKSIAIGLFLWEVFFYKRLFLLFFLGKNADHFYEKSKVE